MINLPTNIEVPIFTPYGNIKGVANCRKWVVWVVRCHPRSVKIAPFDRAHELLLAFHSNYVPMFYHFWDRPPIARYWSKRANVNLLHLYLAPPLGVMSLEFPRDFWHRKTRVSGLLYGVLSVILGLAVFVQLRLVTDRQTDGQTVRHMMTANTVLA